MSTTLSPVSIQTYATSDMGNGMFTAGTISPWASAGSIKFQTGEVELIGDPVNGHRPSLRLTVVKALRGGSSPEFICRRENGELVGVIAAQQRKKGG